MPQRSVRIVNEAGIHARPAAEIVKTAAKFRSDVTISKDGLDVNAKSIMGVMMLAAECGSTVLLSGEGDDAEAAIAAIAAVIENGFGETLGAI
jgi:phosphocarrier protein HPr